MLLGTIPPNSIDTILSLYLPEQIHFVSPVTPPDFRINVLGDGVLLNLDAAGVNSVNGIGQIVRVPHSFSIPAADGLIKGRTVELTVRNPNATPLAIFGNSSREGEDYVQIIRQIILAHSGIVFSDFAMLFLPGMPDDSLVDVTYRDGTVQRYTVLELEILYAQESWNVAEPTISNLSGNIRYVQVTPSVNVTAYVMRFVAPHAIVGAV